MVLFSREGRIIIFGDDSKSDKIVVYVGCEPLGRKALSIVGDDETEKRRYRSEGGAGGVGMACEEGGVSGLSGVVGR